MSASTLKDKVAIITGAGSGIGRSIATTFARHRCHVNLIDINTQALAEVEAEIHSQNGVCSSFYCDVSNQTEVVKLIDQIALKTVPDILVNNAGIGFIGSVEKTTEKEFDRLVSVNIKGVYNCLYGIIPYMKKNGGGVILNMASIAASIGLQDRFAYSMTKGAVLTMTYSIAQDYIQENIRCNSISPARVHTSFVDDYLEKNYPGDEKSMFEKLSKTQPIGRMAKPEEIAHLALYLCSDEASFITGCDYPIDGGFIKLR